jgi:hypothetical protein
MEARPNEIQTGLRILARMIAEAYLKDMARRNTTQLSAINEDNRIANRVNNEEEKVIKSKRRG